MSEFSSVPCETVNIVAFRISVARDRFPTAPDRRKEIVRQLEKVVTGAGADTPRIIA